MINVNKTTDNTFKITYLNNNGVELGYAVAEMKPSELKALLKLNDLYFENLYSEAMIPADTLTLGTAITAVIRRAMVSVGNQEFADDTTWRDQKAAGASAIYSEMTSRVSQQMKDKMMEHGYEL